MEKLDKVALILIGVTLAFLSLALRSPFSVGLTVGAFMVAIYGLRSGQRDLLAIAVCIPGFGLLAWWGNYLIYRITPHTIDKDLLRLDYGTAVAMFAWFSAHPHLQMPLAIVYYGLGAIAGIAICSSPKRPELLCACVLAAMAAPVFYFLFPAMGPKWIGHECARNCIPSLHFSWALLLLIYCAPRLRPIFWAFAILTALATMGLGEHYAIDLMAAVPFTLAVCRMARWLVERNRVLRLNPEPLT